MGLIDNSLKSFRIKSKLPQWVFWLLAIVLFMVSWYAVGAWARQTALKDLALHTDHYAPDGILYQETDYACVPASIAMLLKDRGIDTTILAVAMSAGTDIFGTGSSGVVKAGRAYGFEVINEKAGFDVVNEKGLTGIILFRHENTRHAAYVIPMPEFDLIQVKDPVQGLLHFDRENADEYFGSEIWDMHFFKPK